MNVKTSKIKEIIKATEPTGKFGNIYHHLIMDNGDKIDIGKKSKQEVGTELTYYITDEQFEFNKAKTYSTFNQAPTPSQNSVKYASRNEATELSIIRQTCLKAAVEYHKGCETTSADIVADAEFFEKYITRSNEEKTSDIPF